MSKSMRVDKGAKSISRAVERNKNVWATVDNVALKYTLSVYLYDAGAGLPKLARECSYENTAIRLNLEYSDILHYYEKTVDNGGKCSFTDSNDVDDMVRICRASARTKAWFIPILSNVRTADRRFW